MGVFVCLDRICVASDRATKGTGPEHEHTRPLPSLYDPSQHLFGQAQHGQASVHLSCK